MLQGGVFHSGPEVSRQNMSRGVGYIHACTGRCALAANAKLKDTGLGSIAMLGPSRFTTAVHGADGAITSMSAHQIAYKSVFTVNGHDVEAVRTTRNRQSCQCKEYRRRGTGARDPNRTTCQQKIIHDHHLCAQGQRRCDAPSPWACRDPGGRGHNARSNGGGHPGCR